MVIRKMKSFRRNVQKKGLHIFKQKVGKTGINRTGSFSCARSATERREACKAHLKEKSSGCFDIVYRKE